MKTPGRRITVVCGTAIILCLAFMVMPFAGKAFQFKTPGVKAVRTKVCSCASQIPGSVRGTMPFRGHGPHLSSRALHAPRSSKPVEEEQTLF